VVSESNTKRHHATEDSRLTSKEHKTVSFSVRQPESIMKRIRQLADKKEVSLNGTISLLLMYGLDYLEQPKLQHYLIASQEESISLFDVTLNRIVEVVFNPFAWDLTCNVCATGRCRHCEFLLNVPQVRTKLKEWRDRGREYYKDILEAAGIETE